MLRRKVETVRDLVIHSSLQGRKVCWRHRNTEHIVLHTNHQVGLSATGSSVAVRLVSCWIIGGGRSVKLIVVYMGNSLIQGTSMLGKIFTYIL